MKSVTVLIDGGHLRALARMEQRTLTVDVTEKVAHACVAPDEELLRVLYYDCAPFVGQVKLPVSGGEHVFKELQWHADFVRPVPWP